MITEIQSIHKKWMLEAIRLAEIAFEKDEIPVGAVVVKDNKIIGRGYNQREKLKDPTAHAEILAITAAANTINDWRLNDCLRFDCRFMRRSALKKRNYSTRGDKRRKMFGFDSRLF
jgi:pyrimidine deaminase RibD-like protein